MKRTTVFLSESLKKELRRIAQASGRSEAELIRDGVQKIVDQYGPPRPRIPLFSSGDPTLAERTDELLEGFGEK